MSIHAAATMVLRYTKSWTFARYSGMRNAIQLRLEGGLRCATDRGSRLRSARAHHLLGAFALLVLTGCAHTTHLYTTVYCVTPDQYAKLKQAEPPKVGSSLTGNAQDDLKTIAGSAVRLRTFSDGLLGVIGSCVDPNTEAPAK